MDVLDAKSTNKIDELIDMKKLLETKDDFDFINQILNRLDKYEVSYDELYDTQIGKTIKKLTKSKDKSVSNNAKNLVEKWKKSIKNKSSEKNGDKDKSDNSLNREISTSYSNISNDKKAVKEYSKCIYFYDSILAFVELNKKVTESLNNTSHQPIRNSVRRTIYEALLNKEEVEGNISPYIIENILKKIKNLSIEIEGTLFNELFRSEDKGTKYLVRVKAIASNLQDKKNLDFRTAVIEGSFTPKEITLMDVKKMASSELQSKRLMAEKDSFNSLRLDWHDVHAPVGVGMYTCEKCKGQRTTSKEIQLRGADEPMTLFIRCFDCGNEWRIG